MKVTVFFYSILTFLVLSCGNKGSLSDSTAKSAIEDYLSTNPIYETTNIPLGEIKFNASKDAHMLKNYKELASKGLISMDLEKQKKKFFGKDSIFIYNIKLTDKAAPYIFKQKKERADVKTFDYELNKSEAAKIELIGKRNGSAIVSLKKIKTDFSPLATDNNPNTSFITKTFKLKYDKEDGWKVIK